MSDTLGAGVTDWIPSGFEGLDVILGGGWPEGRFSEVYGPEASGKSAMLRAAVRGVQSQGGFGIILDYEKTMDPEQFPAEGIDPDGVIYAKPDTIEQGLNILRHHLDVFEAKPPNFPIFIGLDSIAAAIARAELEEDDAEDSHIALQARAMGKLFRSLVGRISKRRIHMMFINQERELIGGQSRGGYKPTTTPGGKAAKYYASIRVRTSRIQTLGKAPKQSGYKMQAQTVKNKSFPPHRKASWIIDFTRGPSPHLTTFHTLLEANQWKSSGGLYTPSFAGKGEIVSNKPRTMDQWVEYWLSEPEAYDRFRQRSADFVRGSCAVPVDEIPVDDDDDTASLDDE